MTIEPLGAVEMLGVSINVYYERGKFEVIAYITSDVYDEEGKRTDDPDYTEAERHFRPTLPLAIECAVSMSTRYNIDGKRGAYTALYVEDNHD